MDANPDPVIHLPTGRNTNLAALVEVQDNAVKLTAAASAGGFSETRYLSKPRPLSKPEK